MAVNIQFLSKALVVAFVSSVTFWYSLTPYIVQPHPDIINDLLTKTQLNSYMTEQESSSSSSVIEVENWTKWRLYVKSDNESSNYPSVSEGTSSDSLSPKVIYAGARDQISLASKAVINMEWRPEYEIHIRKSDDDSSPASPKKSTESTSSPILVHTEAPFLSFRHFGIYDHFRTNIKSSSNGNDKMDGQKETSPYTVQIIPRFLFGIPYEKIQQLYGTNQEDGSIDLSRLPIVGLFSDTPTYDRFIIQAYMNLVTMSVIFLLWANNPPETLLGNKAKKPEPKTNGTTTPMIKAKK